MPASPSTWPFDRRLLALVQGDRGGGGRVRLVRHVLVDGHRLPAGDDVLHALPPIASCPDSGIGLRPFAFSVATTAPAMLSFAATTPWMLLFVWTSICSKSGWAFSASQTGHELRRAPLDLLRLEERVQDSVVTALERERVRVGRAAPELRDRAVRVVRPVLLHAGENAERLLATHAWVVERDIDGAGAADDLPVVVDRLATRPP